MYVIKTIAIRGQHDYQDHDNEKTQVRSCKDSWWKSQVALIIKIEYHQIVQHSRESNSQTHYPHFQGMLIFYFKFIKKNNYCRALAKWI